MRKSDRAKDTAPTQAPHGSRGLTNGERSGSHVRSLGDPVRSGESTRAGFSNGMVNGRGGQQNQGLKNGLTNGLTNGLSGGMTNGLTNGFVNGAGAVNGFRIGSGSHHVSRRPTDARKKMILVVVLIAIILAVPYALVYAFPPAEVEIDGYFMDWLKATVYADDPDADNPDIAIREYAIKGDSRGTYFYIETAGTVLNGVDGGADGYYMFVDYDGDAATGYSVRDIGADHLVAVVGWDGSAMLSATYVFDSRYDRDDYAGFERSSDPLVAFKGGKMEVGTGIATTPASTVAVCARHTNASDDWSEVNFGYSGPAVRVLQVHDAPAVTAGYKDEHMLTLMLSVKNGPITVDRLSFQFLGDGIPIELRIMQGPDLLGTSAGDDVAIVPAIRLSSGEPVELDVLATFSDDSKSKSAGITLDRTGGIGLGSNATVTVSSVQKGARVSYVDIPPQEILIDGAFADWDMKVPSLDELGDVSTNGTSLEINRNIDISATKVWSTPASAYFFMSVDGDMLGGTSMPGSVARWVEAPEPGGSMPNVTEETHLYGADFAYVFVDTDSNLSTGFGIGGSEVSVTVVGKSGRILLANAYSYDNGTWQLLGPVDAAIDGYRIEIGSSLEMIGLSLEETYRITFMAQDWRGSEDTAMMAMLASALSGTRVFGGILINEIFSSVPAQTNDWIELYNTGTATIDISDWLLYADTVLVYTFPDGATVAPGEFYVVTDLYFAKASLFLLFDDEGALVDSVTVPSWQVRTYGRTGTPDTEYSDWSWMVPTPGEVNQGQVPIPEFGGILAPLAIVPITFLVIRRTRGAHTNTAEDDSEGN